MSRLPGIVLLFLFSSLSAPCLAQAVDAPTLVRGQTWTYRELDGYNQQQKAVWIKEVTVAENGQTEFRVRKEGQSEKDNLVYRYEGTGLINETLPDGAQRSYVPGLTYLPFPLEEGKSWSQNVLMSNSSTHKNIRLKVLGKVRGWEKIKVPAGEFNALKITRQDFFADREWWRSGTIRRETDWYVPAIKAVVRHEETESFFDTTTPDEGAEVRGDSIIWELIAHSTH